LLATSIRISIGIDDPEERRRRIIAAAEGQSQALKPPPRPFVGAPPRITNFTGREAELYRLDSILLGGDKPAAITQATISRAAVAGMGARSAPSRSRRLLGEVT